MAQSRLEKIGTVYSRVVSLLKGKAMKEEDRPLWLAVYEAFPPKYEPRYDRQPPKKPVQPIFYEEDLIRVRFHKDQNFIPATNLANENIKSATQKFLSIYKEIKEQEELSKNKEDIAYERALQQYFTSEMKTRMKSNKVENKSSR